MIDTSKIIFWLNKADGSPASSAIVVAQLSETGVTPSGHVSDEPISVTADDNGYVEMDLWQNVLPATYRIRAFDPVNVGLPVFDHDTLTVTANDQTANDLFLGNGNIIPTVSFTLASTFDVTAYSIDITGVAADSDGSIAAYLWVIDGVSVATTAALSYTIYTTGEHTIRLVVTDDDGAMRAAAHTVTLFENDAATAAALAALETAESSTVQGDVDAAQALITVLAASGLKDSYQARLDVIIVGLVAATASVVTAETQQTPENQAAAQALVTALIASSEKSALQVRLDALDAEIAAVVAARLLVVDAETYTWLAAEQVAAQAAVDALQSTTEQATLTARIAAMDDEVAAETSVASAESTRTQGAVDAAQALVDVLDAGDQVALQARIDAIYLDVTLVSNAYAGWEDRPADSPYLSPNGYLARPPGTAAEFYLGETISQGSGWHCVGVASTEQDVTNIAVLGIQSEGLAAVDESSSTDRLLVIGESCVFNSIEQLGFGQGQDDYVLAVDYSGTNPIAYFYTGGTVEFSVTLVTTSAINLVINASLLAQREEWSWEVNTGADTVNRPFPAGLQAALDTFGADTTGFSLGWGGTNAGASLAEAAIIVSGAPGTPTVGVAINLTCTCVDGNAVDQAADVRWYNDSVNWNEITPLNPFATGAAYSFTPTEFGYYRIRAEYYDPQGRTIQTITNLLVDGTVTDVGPTVWDASASNASVGDITAATARFETATPFKLAVIGNQAMWGTFRYFEITLDAADGDFGFGVTTALNGDIMWGGRTSGDLPTDGGGSFSQLNQASGGPLIWNNGTTSADPNNALTWSAGATGLRLISGDTIGFAIDYLDKTAPPIVYIFGNDETGGATQNFGAFELRLTRTPIYPMVYCNTASSETVNPDVTVNGDGSTFVHAPEAILVAQGIDVTSFELGWATSEVVP